MRDDVDPSRVDRLIQAGLASRERFTVQGKELDLRDITFANEVEKSLGEYDFNHANQTMLLADRLAHELKIEKKIDRDALKIAALFHDVGRRTPWRDPGGDKDHAARSAAAAEKWLQGRWSDTSFIEQVTYLVSKHTLSGPPPSDPRLIALWDADSLEAARLAPGTSEGAAVFNRRIDRAITSFAKDPNVWRRWMKERGWQR